jgi:hypothetical protein
MLVLVVFFLLSYFGFVSWARVEDAIESLSKKPAGAAIFHEKIDRPDALFLVFMFSFLTPLALVTAFGLVAFISAMLTGFLESIFHRPGMPDWLFSLVVYVVLGIVALLTRAVWLPHAQGLVSLIARAIVMATSW